MYLVISYGIFALQLLCLMGFCSFLELLEPRFLLFADSGIQSFLESATMNLCLRPAMPPPLAGVESTAKKQTFLISLSMALIWFFKDAGFFFLGRPAALCIGPLGKRGGVLLCSGSLVILASGEGVTHTCKGCS